MRIPRGFFWGASSAAHQAEGGNHNDWVEWELENHLRLAQSAQSRYAAQAQYTGGRRASWEEIRSLAANPLNYLSGQAADHYHRFEEDFDLAKKLGHNAHRFSIEWARIEPQAGVFSDEEISHYRQVVRAVRQRGMEPFVTLWHFTLPLWVRDKGGWSAAVVSQYFARYVERVVRALQDEVRYWITLNEPMVYAGVAYFKGYFPPQKRNLLQYLQVLRNLISAHCLAYQTIKRINKGAQIGIAKHNVFFDFFSQSLPNQLLKAAANYGWNSFFLDRIHGYQDFIGLNYYIRHPFGSGPDDDKSRSFSDLGWELYPAGIYHLLKDLQRYGKPIYITENGLADAADTQRAWYIRETLKNVWQAMQGGVDVRGYFYWSLTDNFEWDKGFWPRFGLIEVDYRDQKRKVRPSAWEYARIIKGAI